MGFDAVLSVLDFRVSVVANFRVFRYSGHATSPMRRTLTRASTAYAHSCAAACANARATLLFARGPASAAAALAHPLAFGHAARALQVGGVRFVMRRWPRTKKTLNANTHKFSLLPAEELGPHPVRFAPPTQCSLAGLRRSLSLSLFSRRVLAARAVRQTVPWRARARRSAPLCAARPPCSGDARAVSGERRHGGLRGGRVVQLVRQLSNEVAHSQSLRERCHFAGVACSETLSRSAGAMLSRQRLLEDRDACESLSGFQFILGATWAS